MIEISKERRQDMNGNIIFNRETAERLQIISLRVMEMIYSEIEELGKELNLNEREKIMAHYYIVENYMEGIQKAMKDVGIDDIIVRKNQNKEKK